MLDVGFVPGLVVGFFVAWVIGAVVGIIRKELNKAGAANKPQTVVQSTSKTPAKVVSESRAAQFNLLIIFFLLMGGAVCFVAVISNGVA